MFPLVLAALWLAPPGRAAAPCSIPGTHATIQAALNDPSCDPIDVAAGTFNENVSISRSVRITGAGTTATVLRGLDGDATVDITDGAPYAVTLEALTITGGDRGIDAPNRAHTITLRDVSISGIETDNIAGISLEAADLHMIGGSISDNHVTGEIGGAWIAQGDAIFEGVRVEGNTAVDATGGIGFMGDRFEFRGGSIVGNESATDQGGGLFVFDATSATVADTTIQDNRAPTSYAAGGYLGAASVTVRDVVVTGNTAQVAAGLYVLADESGLIEDSAFAGNVATNAVGGLSVQGAVVSVRNTTISGNSAANNAGGLAVGTLGMVGTNLTITNNVADADGDGMGQGGGIFEDEANTLVLQNSILSGNRDGSPGAEAPDCSETVTSGGHNIIGTTQGCMYTAGPADMIGVDPMLGPLEDNGGNTLTHALLKGSPAIDAADPALAPATDQRGLARNPDIGAYELVLCARVPVNRIGTEGKDRLTGTNGPDGMLGLGGKDTLSGRGGKDGRCGGGGRDKLNGGGGRDTMKGQGGKDTCNGGGGKDKATCEKERKI
ncbi:MAG: hypothetical protein M3135_04265 [Actinomycetota bacterium]|nr:hypothetical protein [Actinomycetota bacterium]